MKSSFVVLCKYYIIYTLMLRKIGAKLRTNSDNFIVIPYKNEPLTIFWPTWQVKHFYFPRSQNMVGKISQKGFLSSVRLMQ